MIAIDHLLATYASGLTPAGWAMMIGSVGLVLALCAFCVYRAMREPRTGEHMHAPLDIDTHDTDTHDADSHEADSHEADSHDTDTHDANEHEDTRT